MSNFNSASRVAAVLEAMLKQQSNTITLQAWSAISGIQVQKRRQQAFQVNRTLELLSNEIGLLTEQVNSGVAGAPERNADALNSARRATDVLDLSPHFRQYRDHINGHHVNLLRILSDLTPDEERTDENALSETRLLIDELRDYAAENLMGEFREFVLRQVRIMEEAIRSYPVVGIRAFSEGAGASFADFVANQEIFQEAQDEEAKTRYKELVKKFFALAPERAAQIATIVNAVNTIKELTGN